MHDANPADTLVFRTHGREVLQELAQRATGVVAAFAFAWVGTSIGGLPAPRALETMEEAVLTAKANLAKSRAPAQVVLMGDSTCLMHLDPAYFRDRYGIEALNLGLWRDLTFDAYAALLEARTAAGHPPRQIVLMIHPTLLRRAASKTESFVLLQALLEGHDRPVKSPLGILQAPLDRLRDRVINRLIPRSLPDSYRATHGSTAHLARSLEVSRGGLSAVRETGRSQRLARAEYWISPQLGDALRRFRDAAGTAEILVLISPTPGSLALRETEEDIRTLANNLARELGPARVLPAPALWDDADFVDGIHLKPAAARRFLDEIDFSRSLNERLNE